MIQNIDGFLTKATKEIKENMDIAILGLSGGADSTLTALLCVQALGKENVFGIHMPYGSVDMATFNKKSVEFAKYLDIPNFKMDISDTVDSAIYQFITHFGWTGEVPALVNGNARARARMLSLYLSAGFLSTKFPDKRVRVLNTCNASETLVGYETKFGDGAGDISILGNLFKSEIYQLLDYFKNVGMLKEEFIDRNPSAGLWEGQTDEKELGYSYNAMEPSCRILKGLSSNSGVDPEIFNFVNAKYRANLHKMNPMPVINFREFCD